MKTLTIETTATHATFSRKAQAAKKVTLTLADVAQIFIDYDKIDSSDWDERYQPTVRALAEYFELIGGCEYDDYEVIRSAMEALI